MIDFYTNVVQYGNEILVRGIQAGQRFDDRLYYQPTLYHLYKDKTRYKSLDGKYLINKQFKSIKDAKEFIQRYEGIHHGFVMAWNALIISTCLIITLVLLNTT